MRPVAEDIARLTRGTLAASTAALYVAAGATVIATRALVDAAKGAATRLPWRASFPRADGGGGAVRHTLRVVTDDVDAAWPFACRDGATHVIRHDPTTRYAEASLAHEFACVLLAVVRGRPPEAVGVPRDPSARLGSREAHTEECAAWALARAITKGDIWTGAAMTYREHVLAECGVPPWARAPRIPPPTRALVRWLAQTAPVS